MIDSGSSDIVLDTDTLKKKMTNYKIFGHVARCETQTLTYTPYNLKFSSFAFKFII